MGVSNVEVNVDITSDLGEVILVEFGVRNLGKSFLPTSGGGGVERFLFGFSKLAASALKAGDLPLTRVLSELKDMLLV